MQLCVTAPLKLLLLKDSITFKLEYNVYINALIFLDLPYVNENNNHFHCEIFNFLLLGFDLVLSKP